MKFRFALAAALPLSLLVACGGDAAPAGDEGEGEAAGEVLEGTISDAMLPIDQTRSQAPLAAPEPDEGGGGGDSAVNGSASSSEPAEPAEAATQEPAEASGEASGE